MVSWWCCTQDISKSGKPNNGHRPGKDQFFPHFPRRVGLKNVGTTTLFCLSPMLIKLSSKSFMLGFSFTRTEKFHVFKVGLATSEDQSSSCHHLLDHRNSKLIPEKSLPPFHCPLDKVFGCVSITNCGKHFKRWESRAIFTWILRDL